METMPHKLTVLIPDGEEYHSWNVALCLSTIPNIKIHVLSGTRWPLVRFSRYRTSFHFVKNHYDDNARIDTITQLVRKTNVDVILPISEPGIRFVSSHRETLGQLAVLAPTPEPTTFDTTADKWLFAGFLAKHNFPHPLTVLLKNDETLSRQIQNIQFPALIKPTMGAGGKDMHLFENQDSMLRFLSKRTTSSKRFIVQNHIPGHDMGCSVLCLDGKILAYTVQDVEIPNPRLFDNWWGIRFVNDYILLDIVTRLIEALDYSGVAHIDLRYDEKEKRIRVLEFNPRFWASVLGSHAVGVNFPYLACLTGMGIGFNRPNYSLGSFAIVRPLRTQIKMTLTGQTRSCSNPDDIGTSWHYYLRDPLPFAVNRIRQRWHGWRNPTDDTR